MVLRSSLSGISIVIVIDIQAEDIAFTSYSQTVPWILGAQCEVGPGVVDWGRAEHAVENADV